MTDDYEFSDGLLDRVFDMSEELMADPQKPDEFTRTQMVDKYPQFTRKQWAYRLDKMVQEGLLEVRKGQNDIFLYRIAEGAEVDFDNQDG